MAQYKPIGNIIGEVSVSPTQFDAGFFLMKDIYLKLNIESLVDSIASFGRDKTAQQIGELVLSAMDTTK